MHDRTANKEREEGKCERLWCCGMENPSAMSVGVRDAAVWCIIPV
jgi:hypothetical protein